MAPAIMKLRKVVKTSDMVDLIIRHAGRTSVNHIVFLFIPAPRTVDRKRSAAFVSS